MGWYMSYARKIQGSHIYHVIDSWEATRKAKESLYSIYGFENNIL